TPVEIKVQEDAVAQAELALAKAKNPPDYDAQAAQATLNAAQAKLDQLLVPPTDTDLAATRAQIQALQVAVDNGQQAVNAADANLQAAQAKFNLVTQGATDFDLRDAQNKLAIARSAVTGAQAKLTQKQDTIAQ